MKEKLNMYKVIYLNRREENNLAQSPFLCEEKKNRNKRKKRVKMEA